MSGSPNKPSLEFASSDVPSPCIGVCRIDPGSGYCEGCLRSLEEIAAWGGADQKTKRAILERLRRRRG